MRLSLKGRPVYQRNRRAYFAAVGDAPDFPVGEFRPCLRDRFDSAGVAKGQYFHQDLLVARWIYAANPQRHVDVGSRVDGFVAHLAVFREVEVYDIRALHTTAAGITFRQRDIMIDEPRDDGIADSLSCLHAIEHFGLGRYGDPVEPDGWRTAWRHMVAMVQPGGDMYLSTVIGPQRVEFDAHRVFAVRTLVALVEPECEVLEFAYVDDAGDLHEGVDWRDSAAAESFGCTYGCGILRLRCR